MRFPFRVKVKDEHIRRIVKAAMQNGGIVPEALEGYGTPESHEIFMPR